jgi:mannitol/fructose-specific phosphotransferase system IIA component (Ntr-type)
MMRSLLDALQEGRLVELPEVDKSKALEYLALLIEAVPDIGTKSDLVKAVQERETQFNTGIGKGVAVPHCRVETDGELLCAVGWSPKGIDYGSTDGKPVHLIVMYYVPDVQRNLYLKEVSGLAKILAGSDVLEKFTRTQSLPELREHLLDWLSQAISDAAPDAKARMIKLEARRTSLEAVPSEPVTEVGRFIPFETVCFGDRVLVLSADSHVADTFEHDDQFQHHIRASADFETGGYRVIRLKESDYAHGRKVVTAVAFKHPS